jgi:hypothetical protein
VNSHAQSRQASLDASLDVSGPSPLLLIAQLFALSFFRRHSRSLLSGGLRLDTKILSDAFVALVLNAPFGWCIAVVPCLPQPLAIASCSVLVHAHQHTRTNLSCTQNKGPPSDVAHPRRDLEEWPRIRNAKPTPLRTSSHSVLHCSVESSTCHCNTRKVTSPSELDQDLHEELRWQGEHLGLFTVRFGCEKGDSSRPGAPHRVLSVNR